MSKEHLRPGSNGGGRPLGSRNKLQGDFLKALAADFAEHGAGVIRIARIEKPVEYLKIIASVLPRELIVDQGILADLSDEELADHIAALQKLRVVPHQAEAPPADEETKH
jgi:hypothetical protein